MKKFVNVESNITVELAIDIEAYVNKLEKCFDNGDILVEEYMQRRKNIADLLDKNKELINQWKEDISGK